MPALPSRLQLRLLAVVLMLSLLWRPSVTQSAGEDTVYLLNAIYADGSIDTEARAVWAGMEAAFLSAHYTTAGGQSIHILQTSVNSSVANDAVGAVNAALNTQKDLLAVLGPFADGRLSALLSNGDFALRDLVFLAPFTSSSPVRGWSDGVYFTRAGPRSELMVMLSHILNVLRVRRTAFMYLTGAQMGDDEYFFTQGVLETLAREPAALYAVPFDQMTTEVNQTAFDAMADTHPQVVIIWGISGLQVFTFLEALLTDPRTKSAYVMAPSALQLLLFFSYYKMAQAGVITPRNGQVLVSATSFPVSHVHANYIALFRQEMAYFMRRSAWFSSIADKEEQNLVAQFGNLSESLRSGPASDLFFATHPSSSHLMLTGWIGAKLVLQTLAQPTWTANRTAYKAGLFRQNRYIIGGDYVLGDYGGVCEKEAAATGAVCHCNQGGHTTYLSALRDASWQLVKGTKFIFPQTRCAPVEGDLYRPVNALVVLLENYPRLSEVGQKLTALMPKLLARSVTHGFKVNFDSLELDTKASQRPFDEYAGDILIDMVVGPMSLHLDVGNRFVPGPFFPHPHLVIPKRNYLYLMPTLEQEMYVLYSSLGDLRVITGASTSTNVVLRGYPPNEVSDITAVLHKTAGTFNVPNPTITCIGLDAALGGALKSGAINYVVGLSDGDGTDIASFLAAHPRAMVIVSFDDLAVYYEGLVAALRNAPAHVQARFVSFTNLPLWGDTSAAAHTAWPLLGAFHEALPDASMHTPLNLRHYAVAGFIEQVFFVTDTVNATMLTDTVYCDGVVIGSGTTFGRFRLECERTALGEECTHINYGAQSISMLSMHRILNSAVPVTVAARTPSMVYTPRQQIGLTAAQRSGVIAGSVMGGLLLLAAVVLPVCCFRDSRDNAAAPREGREPVTVIFTDIESSTAMWAALPQLMADTIAVHHSVIRQLIRKHGCYEVKTVGDSFMIACKDAYSAVKLACDIQKRLLEHDWGTTEIDSKYHEFELTKAETVEGYVPPTARLSEEEYAALWRGLRVRIGIHTGLSDIRYDEVTKGYDYYGDTSNMAARTEAIANGGQVVATETTWWALSDEERDAIKCTEMGPQGLRGVPFAVEMYQLNAVPGRCYAALRAEIEAILPDDGADETGSSAADALLSSAGTMNGVAASVALVIGGCFAPYPPAQRLRELQPLLNRWNVGAPPRPRQVSEEDYCQGLINRLAIRVAAITKVRQNVLNAEPGVERMSTVSGRTNSNPLTGTSAGERLSLRPFALAELSALQVSRTPRRESLTPWRPFATSSQTQASPPLRRASRAVVHPPESADAVEPFSAPHGSLSSRGSPQRRSSSVEEVVVRLPPEVELRQRVGRRDVWDYDAGDA